MHANAESVPVYDAASLLLTRTKQINSCKYNSQLFDKICSPVKAFLVRPV